MDEDHIAEVALAEREEEMRVGSRALNRRLRELESRILSLREALPTAGSLGWEIINRVETLEDDIRASRWSLYELTANAIRGAYVAADIALWCRRAIEMGACHPRIDQALLLDLIHVRKVPNEPFRRRLVQILSRTNDVDAVKARIVTRLHLALSKIEEDRGGQFGSGGLIIGGTPQGRTLARWLGIETSPPTGNYSATLRLFVKYEQAEALAITLDMSPHEAGI